MRKLEELLEIAESQEIIAQSQPKNDTSPVVIEKNEPIIKSGIKELDRISDSLPRVSGLGNVSDAELDELAQRATNAYDDLMNLGMNVEARYSARIFEVASTMLKNAIDAKNIKIDKKLKMIELQMKKYKLQPQSSGKGEAQEIGGVSTDRNSLLEKLKTINTK